MGGNEAGCQSMLSSSISCLTLTLPVCLPVGDTAGADTASNRSRSGSREDGP